MTPASADEGLQRFVDAQAPVREAVREELARGAKRTHWMWFVFPQLRGLGASAMSWRYGLAGADEARAYLDHPVLGPRLREDVAALLRHEGLTAHQILGSPDDLKLRSCLTLFAHVAPEEPLFAQALARFYDGRPDPATGERLASR